MRNFSAGLDTRRLPETTEPGFLVLGEDGHLRRGGGFEGRASFVLKDILPSGTVGLAADASSLVIFGSDPPPGGLPGAYAYQQLDFGIKVLDRVMSWVLFAGQIYAAARYDDGARMHHYNGAVVAAMNGGVVGAVPGDFVMKHNRKIFSLSGSVVRWSAIGSATDFAGTGAGFLDLGEEMSGDATLKALAPYNDNLAVLAEQSTAIYYFDPNPALNRKVQILNSIGTEAGLSASQFGDTDLFFLDKSGVRSLRARNSSNAATANDVGIAIDDYVKAKYASLTAEQKLRVKGLIEPIDKRFWLVLGNEIAVLSHFPGSKVSGWSIYKPGFFIDDVVEFRGRLYLRSGDNVYVYGGEEANLVYDATSPKVWLPYLDGGTPRKEKSWRGFDVACRGTWNVRVGINPNNFLASDEVCTVDATTYHVDMIPMELSAPYISLRLEGSGSGYKLLESACLYFNGDDES